MDEGEEAGGLVVSTLTRRIEVKKIAKDIGVRDFLSGISQAFRFMRRHDLTIRRRTHFAQRPPEDLDEKTERFKRFIVNLPKWHQPPPSRIGNVDQTPLVFDLPMARTVAEEGVEKIAKIVTTGQEKDCFTVMLTWMLKEESLHYTSSLRGDITQRRQVSSRGHCPAQAKGWMDQALIEDRLRIVWGWYISGLHQRKSYKSEETKAKICRLNIDVAMIPGGTTSLLQPFDVAINELFKDRLNTSGRIGSPMHRK
ncbi:transposable element with KRAB [Octopus vulgaris]|uniref:Transposable element with KRAB n=1 Tax=Octopus vulgaris TaxID=6645 RepID=A0AA36BGT7_OCTVU|nr:transposable element with KRAB [Octopus vulgaris]